MKTECTRRASAILLSAVLLFTTIAAFPLTVYAEGSNCGGLEQVDVYYPEPDDVIQDPVLNWTIRSSLNSIKDHSKLTKEMVGSKKNVYIVYESGAHPENFTTWEVPYLIHDLSGIEYAKYATMVDIAYSGDTDAQSKIQGIKSLEPLSALTQLKILKLYRDGISDISALSTLVNLEELNLDFNYSISDINAVKDMSKLKKLSVQYSEVSDISVIKNLKELKLVNFQNNQITGLPDMSDLTMLEDLNLSGNRLSDEDVRKISKVTSLTRLDISGNDSITDIRPLARLINLEEDKTILPAGSNKEDLFAAKDVYGAFYAFNISKMTADDIDNVKIALEAYDSLTSEQKTYVDSGMVDAARSNLSLVENEEDPVYYEEYDYGGVARPVLNRLDVYVVDKYGKPMSGVTVEKYTGESLANSFVTDAGGKATVKHVPYDAVDSHSLRINLEGYSSSPQEITYEVKDGKTYIINGRRATGFEKHVFVMTKTDEATDKEGLKAAISECSSIDEEHTYTDESYSEYQNCLKVAENVLSDPDATQTAIDEAAKALRDSYSRLQKSSILTRLRIEVVDRNGNHFVRPFKLQVYTPGNKKDAWNIWADGNALGEAIGYDRFNGSAYLDTTPSWADNHVYEIACCTFEPYYFARNIQVKIGVTSDGTRYFKEVDGKSVDSDFKMVVKALPRAGGAINKDEEIQPEGRGFFEFYSAKAAELKEAAYTPQSYDNMVDRMDNAEQIVNSSASTQEDMNAAVADFVLACDSLIERADNVRLEQQIDLYFSQDMYTSDSWSNYIEWLDNAQEVYSDANASQEAVDDAVIKLREAQKALVLRGDKTELISEYDRLSAVDESSCILGFDDLTTALEAADRVIKDIDATDADVKTALELLKKAENEMVSAPNEPEWFCLPNTYVARVVDAEGLRVSGVSIKAESSSGKIVADGVKSDSNGIFRFDTDKADAGDKVTVLINDSRYTCEETHSFDMRNTTQFWNMGIETVDGKNYEYGNTYVTFTVSSGRKAITSEGINVELPSKVAYSGSGEAKPAVTVKDGDKVLVEDVDYTLEYKNCDTEGVASVLISGISQYRENITRYYKLQKFNVKVIGDCTYKGSAVTPELEVSDSYGRILEIGKDYEAEYTDNDKPGTASVTVTLKGSIFGILEKSFEIKAEDTPGGSGSSGGGSAGGGGGGAPAEPSEDPISNSKGDSGSITTNVNLSDKVSAADGKAEVKVDSELGDKIVENAVNNASSTVDINASVAGNAAKTEVSLPAKTYNDILAKTDAETVSIKTDAGTVVLDRAALIAVADKAGTEGDVKLVVETKEQNKNKVVIELKLETSNGAVSDFKGGNATVTVPVSEELAGKKIVCVYIDDNGKYTKMVGELSADKKSFTFTTGHFSTYAILEEAEADAVIDEQNKAEAPAVKVAKASVKLKAYKGGKLKVTASAKNATGYRVYYKKSSWKKYKTYTKGNIKTLNKTFKKLSKGTYTVKVKAYHKSANGNVTWGAISNARTARVK